MKCYVSIFVCKILDTKYLRNLKLCQNDGFLLSCKATLTTTNHFIKFEYEKYLLYTHNYTYYTHYHTYVE